MYIRNLLTIIGACLTLNGISQATISGATAVDPGSTTSYTVSFEYPLSPYTVIYLNVEGGVIIDQSVDPTQPVHCTVHWNNDEGAGLLSIYEDVGTQGGETVVQRGLQSQVELCKGIIGNPVIAVDFGKGSNPGAPLPAGITTYAYQNFCAINPGQYTITSNTNNCRSLWHNVPEDHTPGDVNGYMMMVDAETERGQFYRTTVNGLTGGNNYEFSAYVGNLLTPAAGQMENPRLDFAIYANGVLLGATGIMEIPRSDQFKWYKVGFVFQIPAGINSIVIVIGNANTKAGGNDLVLDDISFAPCLPAITASFSGTAQVDKRFTCNYGTVQLFSSWPSLLPFSNPGYRWERSTDEGLTWSAIPGATALNYAPQEEWKPGIIEYRVVAYEISDPSRLIVSNIITFYVQKMVVDPGTFETYACEPAPFQLRPTYRLMYSESFATLNYTYAWTPPVYLDNPNSDAPKISLPPVPLNTSATLPAPGSFYFYTFTVKNTEYGCMASNTQTVIQRNPRTVYIPGGFTPNGDGKNDYFKAINLEDYPGSRFSIYNGWGERIYTSTGPTYQWDGTYKGRQQPTDTYVFLVEMAGCPNNIKPGKSGTLTLIR